MNILKIFLESLKEDVIDYNPPKETLIEMPTIDNDYKSLGKTAPKDAYTRTQEFIRNGGKILLTRRIKDYNYRKIEKTYGTNIHYKIDCFNKNEV
jgi:hypothetical protein